ncbi:conserved hypothetical protein [Vibrio crassostreae]|nr:conserved hypothetical protein [Vibrio crassostreae]
MIKQYYKTIYKYLFLDDLESIKHHFELVEYELCKKFAKESENEDLIVTTDNLDTVLALNLKELECLDYQVILDDYDCSVCPDEFENLILDMTFLATLSFWIPDSDYKDIDEDAKEICSNLKIDQNKQLTDVILYLSNCLDERCSDKHSETYENPIFNYDDYTTV